MVSTIQSIGNDTLYSVHTVQFDSGRRAETSQRPAKAEKLSKEEITALVEELNKAMQMVGTTLAFYVDEHTKKTVVKVLDAQTHEVIRQIPPEQMLEISQKISELMGILVDQSL